MRSSEKWMLGISDLALVYLKDREVNPAKMTNVIVAGNRKYSVSLLEKVDLRLVFIFSRCKMDK